MKYTTIQSEGSLISAEILSEIYSGEAFGQKAKDFALDKNVRLTDEIAACWADAKAFWEAFKHSLRKVTSDQTGASQTREQWILPLLRVLGFEGITFSKSAAQEGGRTYFISHRLGDIKNGLPIHIEGANVDLDKRSPTGRPRISPHALVQEYLNRTEHLWGIVTNGKKFRILRDSERLSRPTYLEFDLEQMMDGEHFSEFQLLYRLIHRTRWPQNIETAHECLLEQYYQQGIEAGGRIRERLRDGVEEALKIFGNGFLNHPNNEALKNKIKSGEISTQDYYRRLLLLIYRFLFLMVSEERNLVGPDLQNDNFRYIYDQNYSISRLRQKVERPINVEERHWDLWESVKQTFRLYSDKNTGQKLGISPLGGQLFGEDALSYFEDASIYNKDFLHGFAHLSIFKVEKITRRINYGHLDVEELGSVYESLLEYHPVLRSENGRLKFEFTYGTERKSTGSYYTRPELVNELIKSALVPVMEDRLNKAKTIEEKEKALLALKVCDPASGSGHFLLAAARRIGRELAKIRTGEQQPTPPQFRSAVRDVIRHCIYGVDLNPLAVDLCKVALWIEGHDRDLPLTFLDHRIKCGNSLIGLDKMERLMEGIPDDAFKPVTEDDKDVAKKIRALNHRQRQEWDKKQLSLDLNLEEKIQDDLEQFSKWNKRISETTDAVIEDYKKKSNFYENIKAGGRWWNDWTAANIWTSAFFYPLTDENDPAIPTHDKLMGFLQNPNTAHGQLVGKANSSAVKFRFFHWPLEFPEVFEKDGFDVLIGNPPWDRIKFQEREFFENYIPKLTHVSNANERKKIIKLATKTNEELMKKALDEQRKSESLSNYLRHSKQYLLAGKGDINTYQVFAERKRTLINKTGSCGMIVPTGISTDDTLKDFFWDLVQTQQIKCLYGFENEKKLFPALMHNFRFALLTLSGINMPINFADFAFGLWSTEDLDDPEIHFNLKKEDFKLLNPNTKNCPLFRNRHDAEITKKIYKTIPILINQLEGINHWKVKYQTMFHMTNDSHLFKDESKLKDFARIENIFMKQNEVYVPLYEAKMIYFYDHRYACAIPSRTGGQRGSSIITTVEQHKNPKFFVKPRFWVNKKEVMKYVEGKKWLIGYRGITGGVVNNRTTIFSFLPPYAAGNTIIILDLAEFSAKEASCLVANFNSIVLDFITRQKLGGTALNNFILNQLPILPLDLYNRQFLSSNFKDFISEKVLRLVYTSEDMQGYAEDWGFHDDPFIWDEEERENIIKEIDAIYAYLYGLSRNELNHILDHFNSLAKTELKQFGEYRTRRLVLEAWDRLFGSD